MSNTLNLSLNQGEDFYRKLTISSVNGGVTTPVNLVGYTVRGQIRPSYMSNIKYNFVFNILDQDLYEGEVEMTLPSAALVAIKTEKDLVYVYDVELATTGTTEIVTRIMEGTATISPEVTK
jgi:hypothetical protein